MVIDFFCQMITLYTVMVIIFLDIDLLLRIGLIFSFSKKSKYKKNLVFGLGPSTW